jgi:hypothetical protein
MNLTDDELALIGDAVFGDPRNEWMGKALVFGVPVDDVETLMLGIIKRAVESEVFDRLASPVEVTSRQHPELVEQLERMVDNAYAHGRDDAVERVKAVVTKMRRPPVWGPNENGQMMLDFDEASYEADLDSVMYAVKGTAVATTRPRTRRMRRIVSTPRSGSET